MVQLVEEKMCMEDVKAKVKADRDCTHFEVDNFWKEFTTMMVVRQEKRKNTNEFNASSNFGKANMKVMPTRDILGEYQVSD